MFTDHVTGNAWQGEERARQSFLSLAGEDGEIDAYELRDILNKVFQRGDFV